MNDKIWEKIKYWQSKYTWPVSAIVGAEYKNDKCRKKSKKNS